jgi:hypothetical protein
MEEDGIVTTRSVQLLSQWICIGRLDFGELPPAESISLAIEFARFADMCCLPVVEPLIVDYIKNVILTNRPPAPTRNSTSPEVDRNSYHITRQHLISVLLLPKGHPVRSVLVNATVQGYLSGRLDHKLQDVVSEFPEFAVDLLQAVSNLTSDKGSELSFTDPISGAPEWVGSCP